MRRFVDSDTDADVDDDVATDRSELGAGGRIGSFLTDDPLDPAADFIGL